MKPSKVIMFAQETLSKHTMKTKTVHWFNDIVEIINDKNATMPEASSCPEPDFKELAEAVIGTHKKKHWRANKRKELMMYLWGSEFLSSSSESSSNSSDSESESD